MLVDVQDHTYTYTHRLTFSLNKNFQTKMKYFDLVRFELAWNNKIHTTTDLFNFQLKVNDYFYQNVNHSLNNLKCVYL